MNSLDLTQRPPRSPRVRLGGYVILPRMLDKGRAELAGKNGDYHYACPLDQRFLTFVGIDPEALKEQLKTGKGDGEILAWIEENAATKRSPWEIKQWSDFVEQRGPGGDIDTLEFFVSLFKGAGPDRADIGGWFELLDLDDYVTFGGKA
jgi:hypothetical protein